MVKYLRHAYSTSHNRLRYVIVNLSSSVSNTGKEYWNDILGLNHAFTGQGTTFSSNKTLNTKNTQ